MFVLSMHEIVNTKQRVGKLSGETSLCHMKSNWDRRRLVTICSYTYLI